ncbi:hypothetical protein [Saccharopolyspora rectivirgula]|uniref:Nitroreductase domain-containing protein n=1 Tax=Saccharopolyspora rectivirgula TaxID=28042 RepID=A0A073B3B1_9PSEU|nr:hypothetical protein [Saccharopolyspora rectivirgula]KEI45732.1 hypothetical protein GU90_02210 [Saccharopolyspora rectivirgula]
MNGQSTAASDYGTSGWSADEVAVLTDAVEHAPSVHNTHPWWLAVHDRTAVLRERTEAELLHHDPNGRDRSISCGTALTNLVLAVRSLGWRAETRIETGEAITATVVGTQRASASEEDMRRFRAVKQRRSDRAAFTGRPLTGAERDAVAGAAAMPGIQLAWIDGEPSALAVARLLEYAARVYHDDPGYQRELTMWTQAPRGPRDRGLAAHAFGSSGLSAAGLVTGRTRVPDEATLAKRIQHESVCVLGTGNDTAADHVLTGQALQLAWLEATSRGISGSVLTQPLHLVEVRTGLASELELTMVPHVLLRFGRTSAEER